MYLHLGKDVIVSRDAIIGIFDIERTSQSIKTRKYLEKAQKNGQIVTVDDELPASFVLCHKDGKTNVYLTQITAATLGKRILMEIGRKI